jgi:HK97 family phage portal protein
VISLGLSTVEQTKAPVDVTRMPSEVVSASSGLGWFGPSLLGVVREAFPGAWQRNISYTANAVLTQSTVWSCITLIMQDIGKLNVRLVERVEQPEGDIWEPTENSAYSPVLRKPNHYQNRIKFFERWICSKLTRGNTYVLKERDQRGVVAKLYILDPSKVQVLQAPDGSVYYDLGHDYLAGIPEPVRVPASELIHDVHIPLFHDLVGLSPLVACALAAGQSLSIQATASKFFQNNSKPGGVLTAPGQISDVTAERIKAHWEANYAGEENYGKVAVLGNGLKYEAMAVTAVEADLVKQLGWTDEKICAVFHVPPFMVGVGPQPTYDNIAKLNQQYYQQALQELVDVDRNTGSRQELLHGQRRPSPLEPSGRDGREHGVPPAAGLLARGPVEARCRRRPVREEHAGAGRARHAVVGR